MTDPLCGLKGASAASAPERASSSAPLRIFRQLVHGASHGQAVTVETDVLGPVTVTSTNPTTLDTAYGLLQEGRAQNFLRKFPQTRCF